MGVSGLWAVLYREVIRAGKMPFFPAGKAVRPGTAPSEAIPGRLSCFRGGLERAGKWLVGYLMNQETTVNKNQIAESITPTMMIGPKNGATTQSTTHQKRPPKIIFSIGHSCRLPRVAILIRQSGVAREYCPDRDFVNISGSDSPSLGPVDKALVFL